jgi:hypothetical protein
MKVIGTVIWIGAGICALGSLGYLVAAIRQPGRMGIITVLCVWIAVIWPFFSPVFNRVHLLWLIPLSLLLPTLVSFVTLPFRARYAWWKQGAATPLEKLRNLVDSSGQPFPFSPSVFIISIALYVLILTLL